MIERYDNAGQSDAQRVLLAEERKRRDNLRRKADQLLARDLTKGKTIFDGNARGRPELALKAAAEKVATGLVDKIYPQLATFSGSFKRADVLKVLQADTLDGLPDSVGPDGLRLFRDHRRPGANWSPTAGRSTPSSHGSRRASSSAKTRTARNSSAISVAHPMAPRLSRSRSCWPERCVAGSPGGLPGGQDHLGHRPAPRADLREPPQVPGSVVPTGGGLRSVADGQRRGQRVAGHHHRRAPRS